MVKNDISMGASVEQQLMTKNGALELRHPNHFLGLVVYAPVCQYRSCRMTHDMLCLIYLAARVSNTESSDHTQLNFCMSGI